MRKSIFIKTFLIILCILIMTFGLSACNDCEHTYQNGVCTKCNEACAHSYGEWETTTQPTCGADGEKERECSICGNIETDEVAATGNHTYQNGVCTVCGADEVVSSCEHTYQNGVCTKCNQACGHNYGEWETTTQPTCSADGEKERECSICGNIETGTVVATGSHTFQNGVCTVCGADEVVSSCEHTYQNGVCTKCNEACGHNYGEWETTTQPTCGADGEKERECSICGNIETGTVAATGSHTYQNGVCTNCNEACAHSFGAWTTVTQPTCAVAGSKKHTCSICNIEQTENVAATGAHNYVEGICSVCGADEPSVDYTQKSYSDYTDQEILADFSGEVVSSSISAGYNTLPNSSTATYANVPNITINNTVIGENDIVVSASAMAAAAGTQASPTTLDDALSRITAGNTIFLLGGTYTLSSTVSFVGSGTVTNYITITAYNNQLVVFDFSAQAESPSNRGIHLKGNYWHVYGIWVKEAGDNGMSISGSWNIVENCVFQANHDSGLQISRESSSMSNFADWPHDNLVKSCTSFDNCDSDGEDADGFAAKLTCGNDNTFDHCIAYCNADDGWDLYTKTETGSIGRVIIVNCVSFNNGSLTDGTSMDEGDRNGFKLGGAKIEANHYVYNCVAFGNGCHGFTENSNIGNITILNCTSFNNGQASSSKANIMFGDGEGYHYMTNILSVATGSTGSDKFTGDLTCCLIYTSKAFYYLESVTNVDESNKPGTKMTQYTTSTYTSMFVSTTFPAPDANVHTTYRNADGTINLGDFLKLKSDSAWATMGTNGGPLGANLNKSSYTVVVVPTSAQDVIAKITAIGTVEFTDASKDLIYDAIINYLALDETERTNVTNLSTLLTAAKEYGNLAVSSLNSKINALPSVLNYSDVEAVTLAYSQYNKLSAVQKTLFTVDNYVKLKNAVERAEDLSTAYQVEVLIGLISDTDLGMKDIPAIDAAKEAYDALDETVKAMVSSLAVTKLNSALAQYNTLASGGIRFDLTGITATNGYDASGKYFFGADTSIKSGNATIAGIDYTTYVDLEGSWKSSNTRYITFTLNTNSSVTILGAVNQTGRTLVVVLVDGTESGTEVARYTFEDTAGIFEVGSLAPGSYMVRSAGSGIKVYDIVIE